ncbi:MAG TPA: hypothetical protein VFB19_07840 [Mycobacterium sp.]|nr:hypothetical protein [Mycobacterium sp.]
MYPPAGQLYPIAYPPLPEPPRKSTKSFWIACGAAAVFLLAVIGLIVVVTVVPHSTRSAKPDITQLTDQMLVGRSSFPDMAGAQWQSGIRNPDDMPELRTRPDECSALSGPLHPTQMASASLTAESGTSMHINISLTSERPDLKQVVKDCGTVKLVGIPVTITTKPRDLSGVPDWATAVEIRSGSVSSVAVLGFVRGVHVRAAYLANGTALKSDQLTDLVKLFNDEVAKLQAA